MPYVSYAAGALGAIAAGLLAFTQWQVHRINAANPPLGQFAEVTGGRLYYTRLQPQSAPRAHIVLIHGASGSEADMMEPLGAPLLARGFDVIAFDRPGFGWSGRLGANTPAAQGERIAEALKSLGVEKAIIAGHSLGGVVSTYLAISHQELVTGLVLEAPVTHPWPGGDIAFYYRMAAAPYIGAAFANLLAMPTGKLVMDTALASVFSPQPTPPDYKARTGAERALRPSTFIANAIDVSGIFDVVTAQAPHLKEITAPTAVITGDHDDVVLTRIHSYGSARDIPGATLKVLPGVGHSPHWADPLAVVGSIEEVASRIGAPAPVPASLVSHP